MAECRRSELEDDPHVCQLDLFHNLPDGAGGAVRSVRRAIRIDGSREIDYRAPPLLGQLTAEILAEIGLGKAEIDALATTAVVKLAD